MVSPAEPMLSTEVFVFRIIDRFAIPTINHAKYEVAYIIWVHGNKSHAPHGEIGKLEAEACQCIEACEKWR